MYKDVSKTIFYSYLNICKVDSLNTYQIIEVDQKEFGE